MPLSRRTFLGQMATAGAIAAAPAILRARPQAKPIVVDAASLRARIEALSVFGRPAGGTFADGVSRVAYSDADVAGRTYVIGSDARGRASSRASIPPATSSRAAPAPIPRCRRSSSARTSTRCRTAATSTAISDRSRRSASSRRSIARSVRTRHPLEIVVWSAEEGVAFGRGLAGSRIVAGDVKPARHGCRLERPAPRRRRPQARRRPRSHHGRRPAEGRAPRYLELHIEQGGTLERGKTPDRRRRGHRRDRALRGDDHRLRESCGDDADGGAAGCARRGVASDAGGARGRDARAGPPGRHRRPARGRAERAERHSRHRADDDRAARSVVAEARRDHRRRSASARRRSR